MLKKIVNIIICFLIIAGGSTEAAMGPESAALNDQESSPAALMLSGSALDPLLKPTLEFKEGEGDNNKIAYFPDCALHKTTQTQRFSPKDLELLARLVQAESEGEPFNGKVAVAATVLNRVQSSCYPNTIPGVIYQKEHGYQYCPVRNSTINRPAGDAARKAVQEALRGKDPTSGGLSFYNPHMAANAWIRNRPVQTRIGNHVFVR